MAKSAELKEQFVTLRAEGWSYNRIAQELQVAKPTLLAWGKELAHQVSEAQFLRYEAIVEQFGLLKEQRLRTFGSLLQRLAKELEQRDLTEVPTDRLVKMLLSVYQQVAQERQGMSYDSGDLTTLLSDFGGYIYQVE